MQDHTRIGTLLLTVLSLFCSYFLQLFYLLALIGSIFIFGTDKFQSGMLSRKLNGLKRFSVIVNETRLGN